MIKRLTKREKRIFITCLVIVCAYLGYNGVIKPIRSEIDKTERLLETKKRKIKKNLRVIRKGEAIEEEYKSFLREFGQDKSDEQVMSSILSEIEGVANELDLRISDLKPKRVKALNLYNRFSVSLTIDSSLGEIDQFLYALQTAPHLFDIEEVRFDKSSRRRSAELKTRLVLSKVTISQ